MNEELEDVLRRLSELERKLEKYYELLVRQNELDFILNGTYILDQDIDDIRENVVVCFQRLLRQILLCHLITILLRSSIYSTHFL